MLRSRLASFAFLLFCSVLAAQQEKKTTPAKPSKAEIARLVEQLGDNEFNLREEASEKLWQAGELAEPALKEAVKGTDAEVRRRANELLDKFNWGIYPSTPKAIVELINRYQGRQKNEAISGLLDLGPAGCTALMKILAAEDAERKKETQARIAVELPRVVPALLAGKDFTTLETLVTASMEGDKQQGLRNAVAYWLVRGQIDQKIDHYKKLAVKSDKDNTDILVRLYRARGNPQAARDAARQAGRDDLIAAMRYETGDWTGGDWPASGDGDLHKLENLDYRATCKRLQGTPQEFENALDEVRKVAQDLKAEDAAGHLQVATVFFLNQRTEEGLALLRKGSHHNQLLCEILATQNRFDDVIALVEKTRQSVSKIGGAEEKKQAEAALMELELIEARALGLAGEKDKARQAIARLEKTGGVALQVLCHTEIAAGLQDDTFRRENAESVLPVLFPSRAHVAGTLLAVLKTLFPLNDARTNMKQLRALMSGTVPRQDLARWMENAEAAFKNQAPPEADQWRFALAEAALTGRHHDLARQCLEKGSGPRLLLRLGDLAASKAEWLRAARYYQQAWEKDRLQVLPLHLSGKALVRAGQEKEGLERIEQAHWLPLGNESVRHQFVRDLNARRDSRAVLRECETLYRLAEPGSFQVRNFALHLGITASQRHDPAKTRDYLERFLKIVASPHNLTAHDLVNVVSWVSRYEAASLLEAGKVSTALPVTVRCQDILGDQENLVILVVPLLDRLGKKKEAGEVFLRTFKTCEERCKRYPRSAILHNGLAWACAGSRRQLDVALEHARLAVQLEPECADYFDTLAEVYFQRGERSKAAETARKAVALAPERGYFRKARTRIETGHATDPVLSQIVVGSPELLVLLTDEDD